MEEQMIVTKQMVRDRLYFLGASTLQTLTSFCKLDQESAIEPYLNSLVEDGIAELNPNGIYSISESFKLEPQTRYQQVTIKIKGNL